MKIKVCCGNCIQERKISYKKAKTTLSESINFNKIISALSHESGFSLCEFSQKVHENDLYYDRIETETRNELKGKIRNGKYTLFNHNDYCPDSRGYNADQ